MKPLPKNRQSPTPCTDGWFYVNRDSISVVAPPSGNGIAHVSRSQLVAALKLMLPKRSASDRGEKP